MSEYIHGNYPTWQTAKPSMLFNKSIFEFLLKCAAKITMISQFCLFLQFYAELDKGKKACSRMEYQIAWVTSKRFADDWEGQFRYARVLLPYRGHRTV